MCSRNEHLQIKQRNDHFIGFVDRNSEAAGLYNDWLSVVYFYCAIHLVESEFADCEIHNISHKERNKALAKFYGIIDDYLYEQFDVAFSRLSSYCNRSRYYGIIPQQSDIDDIKSRLSDVARYIPRIFANQSIYPRSVTN